ncbi:MAG TPA: cache domain-containing protein [Rhodocyclaceae bacterium]|nr:cache domain-containing protein [Rhodocyclaceae bacterium]
MLARIRSSVRLKLLVLVLSPLLIGVPALLGLVWTWGNQAYERLITYKVSSDLVTAHEFFERVRGSVGGDVGAVAESSRLVASLDGVHDVAFAVMLEDLARRYRLDYLLFLDRQGRAIAGSAPNAMLPTGARQDWPAVSAALDGATHTTVERFSPDALAAISPELRARAVQALVPTQGAAPDARTAEDHGMVIQAASPVFDRRGIQVGVLEGGVLLNGNLELVDSINAIVYRDGSLPLNSRGTATLFLGDTRIATNVRLFEGERALGTRVSMAVREQVLGRGENWLGTAFVVNDDYVSGYEPVLDGAGERIGMLYVGFLEAPLRAAFHAAMAALFAVFVVVSALGSVFCLRWARSIFEPIERMNRVMQQIEGGDAAARVGTVSSRDELGRLAGKFDHLLDTLSAKQDELRRWATELDHKVAERTRELHETNESLRRAQRQLAMSEKLAAIGELTAGVAHEVNNPVAVIQGNLDLLRDVLGPAAEPVGGEIRLIQEQTERIRQIVTRLLQFARPGDFAGYTEAVDVNEVIADSLLLSTHSLEKGNVVVATHLAARTSVEINRGELQQVLINLILNALHAMPDGGRLTLASEDWQDAAGQRLGALLRICDTGHGIAPENLTTIFDPFFTTKKESGTGLGLSISYTLIERYGGRISVASVPGQGAQFEIRLRREAVFDATPEAPGFMRRWHA